MRWTLAIGLAVSAAGLASMPLWAHRRNGDFEYPVTGTISGRQYRCSGGFHGALDIAASCGRCVYAARRGTAHYYGGCGSGCWSMAGGAGCNGGAGNFVKMTHAGGYYSRYMHLRAGRGGFRTDSARIGNVGSTGHSTGPHVHFEIGRYGARWTDWTNSRPCYTGVRAGGDIPVNFPGIRENKGKYSHRPHGC